MAHDGADQRGELLRLRGARAGAHQVDSSDCTPTTQRSRFDLKAVMFCNISVEFLNIAVVWCYLTLTEYLATVAGIPAGQQQSIKKHEEGHARTARA